MGADITGQGLANAGRKRLFNMGKRVVVSFYHDLHGGKC